MAKIDNKYHDLLEHILKKGKWYEDPNRKGVKRLQIPSYTFEYDLTKGFPAITTKKLAWKSVVGELIWFLKGDTNIKYLIDNDVNIWNKDAYNYYLKQFNSKYPKSPQNAHDLEGFISLIGNENSPQQWMTPYKFGDLGRVYGAQWRSWIGIDDINYPDSTINVDQISNLIKNLKEKPLATDHIVTAWNPAELNSMALPPCHNFFQINVWELTPLENARFADKSKIPYEGPKYGFELVWHQRSVDTFLGLPFNIASYGLLAYIIGKITNMIPMSLKGNLNNVHLYENSIEAVKKQLSRDVDKYSKSELMYSDEFMYLNSFLRDEKDPTNLDDFTNFLNIDMFKLDDYKSYPSIKVEMLERNE